VRPHKARAGRAYEHVPAPQRRGFTLSYPILSIARRCAVVKCHVPHPVTTAARIGAAAPFLAPSLRA
jgi:hypothetical protein